MLLTTEQYIKQVVRWPESGRHIMAQYDTESVVVYQAYRPGIGHFAAQHGYFGKDFKLNRMSWIKTSFLWMMHRSGWATKENQRVILAIWLSRSAFEGLLRQAVPSSFLASLYPCEEKWKEALKTSSVRLQWDPDYDPSGNRVERRAIQLGLRGKTLLQFAQGSWIRHIEDITDFVESQREYSLPSYYPYLITPYEEIFTIEDTQLVQKLQLSSPKKHDDS